MDNKTVELEREAWPETIPSPARIVKSSKSWKQIFANFAIAISTKVIDKLETFR